MQHRSTVSVIVAVVTLLLATIAPAHADAPGGQAAGAVRRYFDAFLRLDEPALDAITAGQATRDTRSLVDHLRREAHDHGVSIQLRADQLYVQPLYSDGSAVHVSVHFSIDVIAHKWMFTSVAKHLRGHATFDVALASTAGTRITGIQLALESA
jgi:hypothetical protein